MCRSCQVSPARWGKIKSRLASREDRSLLMLTRSEPSVCVALYDERWLSCCKSDSVEMMEIRCWGRGGADWQNERLSKSSLFIRLKKTTTFIYMTCSSIRAWHRLQVCNGSPMWIRNSLRAETFLFVPFVFYRRNACGRLAARKRENRCCMGRQSEGSTHKKGGWRVGLCNLRAALGGLRALYTFVLMHRSRGAGETRSPSA